MMKIYELTSMILLLILVFLWDNIIKTYTNNIEFEQQNEIKMSLKFNIGKDPRDEDSARLLLHFCILLANEKGQPEGQDLHEPTTSSSTSEQSTDTRDQVGI